MIRLGLPVSVWQNVKDWDKWLQEEKQERWERKSRCSKRKGKQLAEQQPLNGVWQELCEQQTALCFLGDHPYETYCVYERSLWEKIDTVFWREYWQIPHFREYHGSVWVEELVQHALCDSWLIIGYAPCIGTILRERATKLREVRWILKPQQYTEAVQEFLDELYEEFGMVIGVQILEPETEWYRVRLQTVSPVNVLDFSGEEKLSVCDVAKGSIWLDMDSLEGKQRRMEVRSPQITYISSKKLWANLDTIGKNRYNT